MRESRWLTCSPAWLAEDSPALMDKARDMLNSLTLATEPIIPEDQQRGLAKLEKEFIAKL